MKVLPAMLLAGSSVVSAAPPGSYFGLALGSSALGDIESTSKEKESGPGGRAFIGFNINRIFGIEANYNVFDKTSYLISTYPAIEVDYTLRSFSLVGKLYLPLEESNPFNVYALLGVAKFSGKATARLAYANWQVPLGTESGFVPTAGLGVSYDFNQHVALGFELSGFGKKDSIETIGAPASALATLGITYRI